VGHSYGAICNECGTGFEVNEGSGMIAMPFHCNRCGKEWWWEFGPGGPMGKEANPPSCECGGRFTVNSPPRCPNCRSKDLRRDPGGYEILYD
jgi:predicted Zn-ribbon and HTH transcriptional regulator